MSDDGVREEVYAVCWRTSCGKWRVRHMWLDGGPSTVFSPLPAPPAEGE